MSTTVMGACWPLQMPLAAKAVLISLADNANDQGVCWPSIEKIAERTCMHRASVIRAIVTLEKLGHVVANRTNGRHTSYVITPNLDETTKPVARCDRLQKATGSRERPDPSHKATAPVAQSDTNRKEPSRTECVSTQREAVVQAAIALRALGAATTPSNPNLIAALAEGVNVQELTDMATAYPGHSAAYIIAAARRQHADAATPIVPSARGSPQTRLMSKTMQSFMVLERIKNYARGLGNEGDSGGPAETPLLEPRRPTSS